MRNDVAADSKYQSTNPTTAFFTGLVPVTQYRPAYAEYPKVSDAIQVAMEAVITGQSSPADAMKAYTDDAEGHRRRRQCGGGHQLMAAPRTTCRRGPRGRGGADRVPPPRPRCPRRPGTCRWRRP